MKPAPTILAAAAIALAAVPAAAAEAKTWYVYCEGADKGDHWAVFSENFWPHPLTEGYGREAGSAAKAFFEARHNVHLDGCAAVNFVDSSLAEHSRSRTAQLHKKMGDRVLYLPLPREALPVVAVPAVAAEVTAELRPAAAREAPGAERERSESGTLTMVPQRSDR